MTTLCAIDTMKFEHLVQINDPELPLLQPLTRSQLWQGLLARAYRPTEFVLGLQSCAILSDTAHGDTTVLQRELDFGSFKVRDSIRLVPESTSTTRIEATSGYPACTLVICIEEPVAEALFLRFTYQWDEADAETELDQTTRGLREQAYLSADLDTVRRIRELAHDCTGQSAEPRTLH